MREVIIDTFPAAPDRPVDIEVYLKATDDSYVMDAYHSLSIEGYRVSPELIERVRSGRWDPEEDADDRQILERRSPELIEFLPRRRGDGEDREPILQQFLEEFKTDT